MDIRWWNLNFMMIKDNRLNKNKQTHSHANREFVVKKIESKILMNQWYSHPIQWNCSISPCSLWFYYPSTLRFWFFVDVEMPFDTIKLCFRSTFSLFERRKKKEQNWFVFRMYQPSDRTLHHVSSQRLEQTSQMFEIFWLDFLDFNKFTTFCMKDSCKRKIKDTFVFGQSRIMNELNKKQTEKIPIFLVLMTHYEVVFIIRSWR